MLEELDGDTLPTFMCIGRLNIVSTTLPNWLLPLGTPSLYYGTSSLIPTSVPKKDFLVSDTRSSHAIGTKPVS